MIAYVWSDPALEPGREHSGFELSMASLTLERVQGLIDSG